MVTGTTVKGIISNTALTQELERIIGIMLADRGLKGKTLNNNEITVVVQSGGQGIVLGNSQKAHGLT